MAAIKALIGDKVKDKAMKDVDVDSFCGEGRYVGLYFSAHWCPPCRMFTPKLAAFYKKYRESGKTNFEIVFVSSDRDAESFKEYYNSMPWLCLPFEDEERKTNLKDKYLVGGIPTFAIFDGATGELVLDDAVEKVDEDPEGTNFPWKN